MGPARMPASPASALPMPNTSIQMRRRSTPSAATMSGSREPARMTSPTLVRLRNTHSATTTTMVTAITNSR